MAKFSFADLVLYFAVYSIIGWVCEVIYCSIKSKKLVKCGFLAGPYCPVFGFGSVLIIITLYQFAKSIVSLPILFIASVLIASILEYFTSWLIEKLFNIRLWDYSNKKFNINGRVCLQNSILFGFMGLLLLYVVQPIVVRLVSDIPIEQRTAISSLFIAAMLIDLITTLNGTYKLREKLEELQSNLQILKKYNENFKWYDKNDTQKSLAKLESIATERGDKKTVDLVKKINDLLEKDNSGRRILSSFAKVKSKNFQDGIDIVKQFFVKNNKKLSDIVQTIIKKIKTLFKKDEVKTDAATESKSFASGINFYKLFWVFFIASFIGYVVETLFCLITQGRLESRQEVIYGPFSQIYGFGAVLMVISLNKLVKKGDRWVFVGGAIIGGAFEVLCSFFQEFMFGAKSWDYSDQQFSFFGGRTSLLFMFFWGILGVVFMKNIYPRLSDFVERIPNKHGVALSWILVVFMTFDLIISGCALYRWSQRVKGVEPSNKIEAFLDKKYPDSLMKVIYPSMDFAKEDNEDNKNTKISAAK